MSLKYLLPQIKSIKIRFIQYLMIHNQQAFFHHVDLIIEPDDSPLSFNTSPPSQE